MCYASKSYSSTHQQVSPQGCSTLARGTVVGGGAWALHVTSPTVLCITQVIPAGVKPGAAAYPHLHHNGTSLIICTWYVSHPSCLAEDMNSSLSCTWGCTRTNQHPKSVMNVDLGYMLHWLMRMLVSCVLLWCLGVQRESHYLQARTGFPTAVDVMQELCMLHEIAMKHDKNCSATRRGPSSFQGSCQFHTLNATMALLQYLHAK